MNRNYLAGIFLSGCMTFGIYTTYLAGVGMNAVVSRAHHSVESSDKVKIENQNLEEAIRP